MAKGKIYLADHEGQPTGIGQNFQIYQSKHGESGYAAFLQTDDGNVRIGDFWETPEEALTALTTGGGGTIIIILDDLRS